MDQYDFEVPAESEAYHEARDEFDAWEEDRAKRGEGSLASSKVEAVGEDGIGGLQVDPATGEAVEKTDGEGAGAMQWDEASMVFKKKLKGALLKRTIKCLPLAQQVLKDYQAAQKMLQNGCVGKEYWVQVQQAKADMDVEIENIVAQAKWLEPGRNHHLRTADGEPDHPDWQPSWNEYIFPQAAQICRNEHQKVWEREHADEIKEHQEKAEHDQRRARQQQERDAKRAVVDAREKETREERRLERERTQILAELMQEGGDGRSSGAKKRPRSSKGKSKRA